jgi:hypothetical protein
MTTSLRLLPLGFALMLLAGAGSPANASGDTDGSAESQEPGEPNTTTEGEAKGIIPKGTAIAVSTQPITPISIFPEKQAIEQGKEELEQATALWRRGEAEAASDMALQAFDDLMDVKTPRGKKRSKERNQIRALRRQAAGIYLESGLAFIKSYVDKAGRTSAAVEEGRSRMEDFRDVAREYEELNRLLNREIEKLTVKK